MYHVRKMREDLSAARHGLKIWHLGQLVTDPVAFEKAVRGKMFATFVLAGAFSAIALPIGIAAQAASNSAWVGMMTSIIVGHAVSNIAFLFIWGWTNRDLYAQCGSPLARTKALLEDILPLLWAGLKVVAPLLFAALPINGLFAFLLDTYLRHLVRYIPIGFIMVAIEMLFFNGTYIRLMGNLFERYAGILTRRYCSASLNT